MGTLPPVLVLTAQAAVFAANCYVVAPRAGGACLIIDPGAGVADAVEALVAEHGLEPVAIAATHGHPDHIWDAARLGDSWGIPLYLHADDLDRLSDPARALGPGVAEAFLGLVPGAPWRAPADVRPLPTLPELDVGHDIRLGLVHAPGHTPGSTLFVADGAASADSVLPRSVTGRPLPHGTPLVFTGDVLFAGSVGRTDLPGGDGPTMAITLGHLRDGLPREAWLLPGHGPMSTMAFERARNPYLDPGWLARGLF